MKNLIIGSSLSRLDADTEYMGSARRKELARQVRQRVTLPAGISTGIGTGMHRDQPLYACAYLNTVKSDS
jgi:hypothetical protein